jgi:hypothetical protein
LIQVYRCRCGRGPVLDRRRSTRYMLSCGHHTAIFIISMFMLLLLNDLLAKFVVTCTLKDKLTTWLCLVEGYLASLHDLVSFKIEHTKCSRVRCVTKKYSIDQPSLELARPVWCTGLTGLSRPPAPPATFRSPQAGTVLTIVLGPGHLHTRLEYTIGRVILVLVSPLLCHCLLTLWP